MLRVKERRKAYSDCWRCELLQTMRRLREGLFGFVLFYYLVGTASTFTSASCDAVNFEATHPKKSSILGCHIQANQEEIHVMRSVDD